MENTLRLTYRDGQPVFDRKWGWRPVFDQNGFRLGHTLCLHFGYYLDSPRFCSSYDLRLSADGCSIEKSSGGGWDRRTTPPDPVPMPSPEPMLLEMSQRINQAIGKGEPLDLTAYLNFWAGRDNRFEFKVWNLDFSCSRVNHPYWKIIPIPNDYGVDFCETQLILPKLANMEPCHLRLAFREGHPVFDREGSSFGRKLTLNFGTVCIGDIDCTFISYHLWLSPARCCVDKDVTYGWYDDTLVTGLHPDDAVLLAEDDPMVLEMAQHINQAINQGETLNLFPYLKFWSEREKEFNFSVWDEAYSFHPGFQKVPTHNDYGVDFFCKDEWIKQNDFSQGTRDANPFRAYLSRWWRCIHLLRPKRAGLGWPHGF